MADEYEVIGFDDDDDVEEVGALNLASLFRGRAPVRRAAPVRRVAVRRAAIPAKGKTIGRRIIASKQRVSMLPLGSVSVAAANGTGQLQVTAQGPMQPHKLVLITGASRGAVQVTNIRVGAKSVLEGTSVMPIEAFREDADEMSLMLPPIGGGISVTIDLKNTDATTAAVVSGVVKGLAGD